MDFLQKPVTYSKSLVHLSKVSICQWTLSLCHCSQTRCKMLSHVVNITVHSVSITYCKLWQQFGWQLLYWNAEGCTLYAIYPFHKYKFTHYCMWDNNWKRLDMIYHSYTFTSGLKKTHITTVRETDQCSSKGIIYDFIGNLDRITVLRLITKSASDSLNEPYNINSALDIKIQNIVKTLLNSTVTRSAV